MVGNKKVDTICPARIFALSIRNFNGKCTIYRIEKEKERFVKKPVETVMVVSRNGRVYYVTEQYISENDTYYRTFNKETGDLTGWFSMEW